MAIAQAGSTLQFGINNSANTGTVSSAVTVPADAEIAVVHVSGYGGGTANFLSSGSMTLTKAGADTAMTSFGGGAADSNTGAWQAAGFYLLAPDTGSSKSLKWDWVGTGTAGDSVFNYAITFWKGIDTGSPVRDSDAATNNSTFPKNTPTLTCVSGDLIVAHLSGFVGAGDGSGDVTAWNNLTELSEPANFGYSEISIATGSPSGDTTVGVQSVTAYGEGGVVALVLKAAAAAGKAPPIFNRRAPRIWRTY
jgi:hypothetical protein